MIKVILCDDHTLILRGLRELLSSSPGIAVVGEATDYGSLRTLVRDVHPDVVVLDINLPGRSGLEALASLNELEQPPRVLMLSQFAEDQYGLRAQRAGAMGYLNKSCDPALIVEAVRQIAVVGQYQLTLQALPRLWMELLMVIGLAVLVFVMIGQAAIE